ncbi:MAG: type II toxin-antitoxin system VapC family toxin [Chloroflexi bacterium]|nr:type II toxin-antitoxin system VapC family toxin [Chloroflexota bacterium]
MVQVVLDASALLSALHSEPGGQGVVDQLERAAISSVNLSEAIQQSLKRKVEVAGLREDLEALGLTILPFTAEDGEAAARLWPATRSLGLSLGDRACLTLAQRLGIPTITADKAWSQFAIGVSISLIR